MGWGINVLRKVVEKFTKNNKFILYLGGGLITLIVVFMSGISGWIIEKIFLFYDIKNPLLSKLFFSFILSSSLAARSLNKSIFEIINLLNSKNDEKNLSKIKEKLSFIVGRDVERLDKNEILRAAAETASENSVDGVFAPLFWMFFGTILWQFNQSMPGPLTLAWIFKASSTIDSMIGYKEGTLKWIGFTGAKLDDLMTWIPSRIVLITLPLCCKTKQPIFDVINNAWRDGLVDSSPNSGISEAIFAYCANVRMGGINFYNGKKKIKPIIASPYPIATIDSVKTIIHLSLRLEFLWLFGMFLIMYIINF